MRSVLSAETDPESVEAVRRSKEKKKNSQKAAAFWLFFFLFVPSFIEADVHRNISDDVALLCLDVLVV